MDKDQATREYVQRLTNCQPRLYAYIMTLVLDPHQADDVLQQTNLVLWEKLAEYLDCENFDALACRVAHFQVLAQRRDRRRERERLLFDDALLARIAASAGGRTGSMQQYLAAMRDCMARLTDLQRELLRRRYEPGGSVQAIADFFGESPNNISATLYRIRKTLLACIREKASNPGEP